MEGIHVHDNGTTNPLIEIEEGVLLNWLRDIADQAGYADRIMSALQIKVHMGDGAYKTFIDVPRMTLMVSNIVGSRTVSAQKQPNASNCNVNETAT